MRDSVVHRSVQLVARNRKCGKGLNNVPCVVRSCNKLHATRESRITYRGWFIRATSCTLHSKWITLLMVDNALFEKTHAKITALYFMLWLIWSCIKMHVTRQSINYTSRLIIRATSCTLRTKLWTPERVKSRSVRDSVVPQDARYNMELRSRSVQLVARNE